MTYHLFVRCGILLIAVVVGFLTVTVTLAQSSRETAFQSNQIGTNSFVSGSKGSVYLVFDRNLYHKVTDEADEWNQIANGVLSVTVDPNDDNVLYAINVQSHIIKSLDGGKTWITLNSTPSNARPWFLYINPSNSAEVFAGTNAGLIKTSDAGFNWQFTSPTGLVSYFSINPKSSSYYALVGGTIYISADKGGTWKKSESGLPTEIVRGKGRTASKVTVECGALLFVDREKPFLLAATMTKGIYRSDDDGASWTSSSAGIAAGKIINGAFVGSNQIVLFTNDSIYSSADGAEWRYLSIKGNRYQPQLFLGVIGYPQHDGLLLLFRFEGDAGDVLRIGYLDPKGNLIGLNYGVLPHSEVDNVWVGSMNGRPAIFAATANLNSSDQTQRYTRPTFISVSQDGGYSWEVIEKADYGEQALVRGGQPTEMWIYGKGIQKTEDGWLHWTILPGIQNGMTFNKIEPDPKDENVLYYCVGINECHVFRYQYEPSTGQGQAINLKVLGPDIVVEDDNSKMLFTGTGQLSTDGGWTWTDKSKALSNLVQGIAEGYRRPFKLVSFHGGQILAVVGKSEPTLSGTKASVSIIKSSDMGDTWQKVYSFPNEQWSEEVFLNPNNPSDFFIVTSSSSTSKVYETQDAGENWHQIYARDVVQKNGWQDVEKIRGVSQMTAGSGRILFVGGSHGLWKSEDEGQNWKRIGGVQ